MNRTRVSTLILLGILGAVAGAFVELLLSSNGHAIIIPELALPIALLLISVLIILLAVPIYRFARRKAKRAIDPYYATRVVMLAKACALSGALLTGLGAGVAIYLLTRMAAPSTGPIALAVSTLVASGVLLAAGLIAEHMCTIPPSDSDDDDDHRPTPIRVKP